VTIDQIVAIAGHRWEFQNYYTTSSNPYEQAENQLFALLGYCDREPSLRRKVSGRALVCLPLITEDQWYHSGFYQLPAAPPLSSKIICVICVHLWFLNQTDSANHPNH
jgi:hypothetical protein